MRRAVETFESDFARWDLHLPAEAVEARRAGQIREAGWSVRYNFGRDTRGEYLDYYASPRDVEHDPPGDDWHVRLYVSGERVVLPTVLEAYMYGRDPTWEELERARRQFEGTASGGESPAVVAEPQPSGDEPASAPLPYLPVDIGPTPDLVTGGPPGGAGVEDAVPATTALGPDESPIQSARGVPIPSVEPLPPRPADRHSAPEESDAREVSCPGERETRTGSASGFSGGAAGTRTHDTFGTPQDEAAATIDGVPSWDAEPWGTPAAPVDLPPSPVPLPNPKKVFRRADLVLTADVASIDPNVDPDVFKPWWFRPTARRAVLAAAAVVVALAVLGLLRHRSRPDQAQPGADPDSLTADPGAAGSSPAEDPASSVAVDRPQPADSTSSVTGRTGSLAPPAQAESAPASTEAQPDLATPAPDPADHGADEGMAKPAGPQSLPAIIPSRSAGPPAAVAGSAPASLSHPTNR